MLKALWNILKGIIEKLVSAIVGGLAQKVKDRISQRLDQEIAELEPEVKGWEITVLGISVSLGDEVWDSVVAPNLDKVKAAVLEAVDESLAE